MHIVLVDLNILVQSFRICVFRLGIWTFVMYSFQSMLLTSNPNILFSSSYMPHASEVDLMHPTVSSLSRLFLGVYGGHVPLGWLQQPQASPTLPRHCILEMCETHTSVTACVPPCIVCVFGSFHPLLVALWFWAWFLDFRLCCVCNDHLLALYFFFIFFFIYGCSSSLMGLFGPLLDHVGLSGWALLYPGCRFFKY